MSTVQLGNAALPAWPDFRDDPSRYDHVDRATRTITDTVPRDMALGMMRRVKRFLEKGIYRDGSLVKTYRAFIELTHRQRVEIIAYIEAELIAVTRIGGYVDYYVLVWHGNREDFALRLAPSE